MGKKRTEREAEVALAQNEGDIIKNDVELNLVNGDPEEKKRKKKKKMKEEERRERDVEAHNADEIRPQIEAEVANGDTKQKKKKKKKEKLEGSNGDVSDELPTVSIALPGSIINNAQSLELATLLAGQIARAATIFRIDEVVVFDNVDNSQDSSAVLSEDNLDKKGWGAAFLLMILRYMETPQYLRKSLFPKHDDLNCVGSLPPLDSPHHLRKHEWAPYREGVTLRNRHPKFGGSFVAVGLDKHVLIDQAMDPGKRVTVSMGTDRHLDSDLPHQVVSTSTPREEAGMYWGYKVRYASNISTVFKNCPYKGGYDHLIGTSEHGISIKSSELSLPSFRHLLIAFGGLEGLEVCFEEDNTLKGKNVRDVFDQYLNVCPNQGSRTIRTEEAIFISLQYFQEPINRVLGKS